jgi:Cytochrome P450
MQLPPHCRPRNNRQPSGQFHAPSPIGAATVEPTPRATRAIGKRDRRIAPLHKSRPLGHQNHDRRRRTRRSSPAKGSRVQLGTGAANHDPSEFKDPETLDLTRSKPQSLAFGYGPHFCIGATLARLETQIALSGLLRRAMRLEELLAVRRDILSPAMGDAVNNLSARDLPAASTLNPVYGSRYTAQTRKSWSLWR